MLFNKHSPMNAIKQSKTSRSQLNSLTPRKKPYLCLTASNMNPPALPRPTHATIFPQSFQQKDFLYSVKIATHPQAANTSPTHTPPPPP